MKKNIIEIRDLVRRGYDYYSYIVKPNDQFYQDMTIRKTVLPHECLREYYFVFGYDHTDVYYESIGEGMKKLEYLIKDKSLVDIICSNSENEEPKKPIEELFKFCEKYSPKALDIFENLILLDREPLQVFENNIPDEIIVYRRMGYLIRLRIVEK